MCLPSCYPSQVYLSALGMLCANGHRKMNECIGELSVEVLLHEPYLTLYSCDTPNENQTKV